MTIQRINWEEKMSLNIVSGIGEARQENGEHGKNSLIFIVTIGFEELSKFLFFSCPCDRPRNKVYGLLFMFGPAFILWLIGILAQGMYFLSLR